MVNVIQCVSSDVLLLVQDLCDMTQFLNKYSFFSDDDGDEVFCSCFSLQESGSGEDDRRSQPRR